MKKESPIDRLLEARVQTLIGRWREQPSKSRSIAAFVGDRHACASLYVGGYSSTTRPYQPEPRTERDHASSFSFIV